ncbi:putative Ig domain-containing protein [Chryseobacterium sp. TY3]
MASAVLGSSYAQTIIVAEAQGAANFSITSGALPSGLSLSATGLISGTPTAVGNYNFTVTATDTSGCTGSHGYSMNVVSAISLSGSQSNVTCHGGNNGTAKVTASGGTAPYTYSWNTTPMQNADTATNLSAGYYTVTVTDASSSSQILSFQITEPAPINVTGNSTCNNTSASLTATGAQQYFWYDQIGDVMPSYVGNVYNTPTLTNNTIYYAQAVSVGNQTTLETTFAGGNNQHGNMINVSAQKDLIINSFDVSPMGDTTIEVYYKEGSYSGFENNPSAWKLLGSAPVTYTGNPVNAVVGSLYIPAGKNYALYVTSTNASMGLNNTTVTSVQTYTDQNMSIEAGIGLEYPFTNGTGVSYNPRAWNGRINYDLVTCQSTRQAVAVTVNTTAAPTGDATQSFNENESLAVLVVNGSNIKWYASQSDAASHTNQLPMSTTIVNNTKYYATQTLNTCESTESLEVLAYNATLASNEITNQSAKIYPNPVKEILNIDSKQNISQLKIYSLDGRLLMERKNMTSKSIDVSTLPMANYIIKIYTEKGEELQYRLIKK